jgi:GNAT superfamily N-acetyltransferase
MSTDINPSAQCYVGYIENNPVCFFAILHFPHNKVKNFKKGHRLVVLPDYQGLGIGHVFSTEIAELYKSQGFRFIITSSTKSLYHQRSKDPRWIVSRKGRLAGHKGKSVDGEGMNGSKNKITFSYEYIGVKNTPSTKATPKRKK